MQTETNVTAPNSTQVTTPDEAAEIDRRLLREVRPAADLLESTDRWLLRVELPGVRIEDVDRPDVAEPLERCRACSTEFEAGQRIGGAHARPPSTTPRTRPPASRNLVRACSGSMW